ncbi:hypothetical protein C8F04DRAFT_1277938 [Mycena alexandri]|uniref:Uncharacterized protein n=1 Tax=Mycena alexandri TaxID=1745969 RepID=A0AAD6WRF7_9AGAR|nr:hypothetical protein C8F04DRAFT_1277938 [Mycena alexandri]
MQGRWIAGGASAAVLLQLQEEDITSTRKGLQGLRITVSFEYLQDYQHSEHGLPASTIQFQLPEYLYDAPPTLASGGGAHPANESRWTT